MTTSATELDDIYDRLIEVGKQDQRAERGWVESFLDHDIDFLRAGSLRAVAFYWHLPEYRALATKRLLEDPSEEVRQVAAMALGGYGYQSMAAETIALLTTVSLDPRETDVVRDAAFTAALVASIIPRAQYPMEATVPGFESKANWQLLVEAHERVGIPVPDRLRALAAARAMRPNR